MGTPSIALAHYAIDPAMSRFTIRAFATGMFSAFGHSPTFAVRDFSGEVQFAPGTLEQACLTLKIKAASLNVQDDVREKDKREIERTMNEQVLESSKYPEIAFKTTGVSAKKSGENQYLLNLAGDLTLRGVTKPQPVAAHVVLVGNTLRAHGDFSVLQTAYGIKPVSVAGGAVKLKDELKCTFDILARKQ
jgi:polyisoprenoid-binding protein YceI